MKLFRIFLTLLFCSLSQYTYAKGSSPFYINDKQMKPIVASKYNRTSFDWSDLEVGGTYATNTDIIFTDKIRRYLLYPKNSLFTLTDIIPLTQISTIYFEFTKQSCANPQLKLDVFLFNNFILSVDPNCRFGVYVEAKNYYGPTLLSPLQRRY